MVDDAARRSAPKSTLAEGAALRHVVHLGGILAIARSAGAPGRALRDATNTCGWCDGTTWGTTDTKGIHVRLDRDGPVTVVSWDRLASIVLAGITPGLIEAGAAAYRDYVDSVMGAGHPGHRRGMHFTPEEYDARLAAFEERLVRYRSASARMRAVTEEVLERALAASVEVAPANLFDLLEAASA